MPSERVQRQIDALLDEAEAAIKQSDWAKVQERANQVLTLDPENAGGLFYLSASARGLAAVPSDSAADPPRPDFLHRRYLQPLSPSPSRAAATRW